MKCRECKTEDEDQFFPSSPRFCKPCATEYQRNNRNPEVAEKYRQANLGYYAAKAAERHAAKMQQTPPWSEKRQIEGLYKFAAYLTEIHGTPIEVDHIVPLQGKEARGLHCMHNLQLLHRADNRSKSNSL